MKNRILVFTIFIGLVSCKKAEIPVSKFVGIWYDTEYVIPTLSKLKINADSNFSYTSGACTWRGFSKGKWKMIGDSIELNSIKSDTCYRMFPFINCAPFDNGKEGLVTIPNCTSKEKSNFLIFSSEKFYIKNDSLILKIKSVSKCPDNLKVIFAKAQKIRK